jgi:hypothetical protein
MYSSVFYEWHMSPVEAMYCTRHKTDNREPGTASVQPIGVYKEIAAYLE